MLTLPRKNRADRSVMELDWELYMQLSRGLLAGLKTWLPQDGHSDTEETLGQEQEQNMHSYTTALLGQELHSHWAVVLVPVSYRGLQTGLETWRPQDGHSDTEATLGQEQNMHSYTKALLGHELH
jgi:hypothetical protein